MNKKLLAFIVALITVVNVAALSSLDREYYSSEEKTVKFEHTFDLKNYGIAKIILKSGTPAEIGIQRPTSEDTDCSDYSYPYAGSCGSISLKLVSQLFDYSASALFEPDQEYTVRTPYFNIILLDIKNNEKANDVIYTLKIVETEPTNIFVKRDEQFELFSNQIAKYGEFGIKNRGVGSEEELYLIFTKNDVEFAPESKAFENGAYRLNKILVHGIYYDNETPLACLNEQLCIYYSGSNTVDSKQSTNYMLTADKKIYLTISEKREKTQCISGDRVCPDNCSYDRDSDCTIPAPARNQTEINSTSEINQTPPILDNISNSTSNKSATSILPSEESKGFFKKISTFFKSLFGKN